MVLTGYKKEHGRRCGGLRSISLIRADAVAAASYDPQSRTYTAIETDGCSFVRYDFREDAASYNESITMDNDCYLVEHELSMQLGKLGCQSTAVVEELAEASPWGVVAVIETNNDIRLLVGYSEKFGNGKPLKLSKGKAGSGYKLSDATVQEIVLKSTDTAKAMPFTGTLP